MGKYLRIWNLSHLFAQGVSKRTPVFGLFPKKLFEKFVPSPIPTGRGQMHPLNGKIFPNEKPPHSFGQRVPKCTPIFGLSSKNFLRKFIPSLVHTGKYQIIGCFWKIFYLVKSPLTYLELQSQMTPYFTEKMRKYFLGCGCFIFLAPKNPFTYSHRERPNAHPESQKIFTPSLIWNWEIKTQPVFQKKGKNFFEKTVCLKNIPSLVPTGRGYLGIAISKKGKKICPPT